MDDILGILLLVVVGLVYLVLLPVILVVATPFVLLWPGKRQPDGTQAPRDIGHRYLRILQGWKSFAAYVT